MKIGDWIARCCLHDLEQLRTQDDIDDEAEFSAEMWKARGPWATCREAVEAMGGEHDREDLEFLVGWYGEREPEIASEISRYLQTSMT
jgi:hypothetical protein